MHLYRVVDLSKYFLPSFVSRIHFNDERFWKVKYRRKSCRFRWIFLRSRRVNSIIIKNLPTNYTEVGDEIICSKGKNAFCIQ